MKFLVHESLNKEKKKICKNKSKLLKPKLGGNKKKYELNIRNFFICKNSRNCNQAKDPKLKRQSTITFSKLSKMANPSDLLPEWTSIRGNLQKLEMSQKSFRKFWESEEPTELGTVLSEAKTKIEPNFRPKLLINNEYYSKRSQSPGAIGNTSSRLLSSQSELHMLLTKRNKEISILKEQVQTLEQQLQNREPNDNWEFLKYVSKFECGNCKWLVLKENFMTHLSFCLEKAIEDETTSDGFVKINNEPEARINHSISTEILHDVYNTYDKNERKTECKVSYKEINSPLSKPPGLLPLPASAQRRSTQLSPLNFYNKENTKLGVDRYKNTDSFINRVSHTNSIFNFQKEDDWAVEITEYDSVRTKPTKQPLIGTQDSGPPSYRTQIERETSSMLNRMQKLRNHLDSLRSPFKNRNSVSSRLSDI